MKAEVIYGQGYVRIDLSAETDFEKVALAVIKGNAKWETPVIIPEEWGYMPPRSSNYAPTHVSEIRLIHQYEKLPEPTPE